MEPLRILHVSPYPASAWAYGGIPRVVAGLTRGLARRGHAVTVVTTDAHDARTRLSRPGGALASTPFVLRDDGVDVFHFPNLSNRLAFGAQLFLPRGLSRWLRREVGRFDVAHLHALRNTPVAVAADLLPDAAVPFVTTPNGTARRIERRRLAKHLWDILLGDAPLTRAARVLAVSETERAELAKAGVPPARLEVLPNPIALDELAVPPERGAFRSRLGLGDAPLVVFLGRISPRKRLDALVRAVARLEHQDAVLAVVGNDMGGEAEARRAVEATGIADRVRFVGLIPGAERFEALADADVVAYAGEEEIFGLVPFEALLVGTPVVVASDSGCGELVRAVGGGETVAPGEVEPLVAALDRILAAPAEWRAAAAAAAPDVRRRFGADVVCERLEEIYREVIAAASRGAKPAAP